MDGAKVRLPDLISGALVLVLFALSGAEGAWVEISVVSIDKQTIRELSKGIVRARIRYEMKDKDDPVKNILVYAEYDCAQQRYRSLERVVYYRNGASVLFHKFLA